MSEVTAVRRGQNTASLEIGIYKNSITTPFCLKVGSYWRQVCARNNGSWYIRTSAGEVTVPRDLIMVLNSLSMRNADSGRRLSRLGRSQVLGGKRLLAARIEATARIEVLKVADAFLDSTKSAAQLLLKREVPLEVERYEQ